MMNAPLKTNLMYYNINSLNIRLIWVKNGLSFKKFSFTFKIKNSIKKIIMSQTCVSCFYLFFYHPKMNIFRDFKKKTGCNTTCYFLLFSLNIWLTKKYFLNKWLILLTNYKQNGLSLEHLFGKNVLNLNIFIGEKKCQKKMMLN